MLTAQEQCAPSLDPHVRMWRSRRPGVLLAITFLLRMSIRFRGVRIDGVRLEAEAPVLDVVARVPALARACELLLARREGGTAWITWDSPDELRTGLRAHSARLCRHEVLEIARAVDTIAGLFARQAELGGELRERVTDAADDKRQVAGGDGRDLVLGRSAAGRTSLPELGEFPCIPSRRCPHVPDPFRHAIPQLAPAEALYAASDQLLNADDTKERCCHRDFGIGLPAMQGNLALECAGWPRRENRSDGQ
jgi:hypothetical protein